MVEKQQDLIRNSAGSPQEGLSGSEFFSGLTLPDIYGRYTLKPGTQIITDIPAPIGKFPDLSREELKKIAARYGIPSIGAYHQGTGANNSEVSENSRLILSAGIGEPMTLWAPYVSERGTIMALARSLAGNKKPLILDARCGNGFVSKLLAVEGEARVIGVDSYLAEYDQLPITPGSVEFREAEILDLIGEFGPTRLPESRKRIYETIKSLIVRLDDREELHFWGHHESDGEQFQDEMRELQELAERNLRPSPVDVAICNFVRVGRDQIHAIRDGIHPRAIVYVKLMSQPSRNSYYDDLKTNPEKDMVDEPTSFNPGRNYTTVARWRTFWSDEWGREAYGQPLGIEAAEVVVQVHKDTGLKKPPVSTVRTYGWDEEIAQIVSKYRDRTSGSKAESGFFLGIDKGALLPAGKPELTSHK